jgi:hypothetical protein
MIIILDLIKFMIIILNLEKLYIYLFKKSNNENKYETSS